jgi:hypothetical protein
MTPGSLHCHDRSNMTVTSTGNWVADALDAAVMLPAGSACSAVLTELTAVAW